MAEKDPMEDFVDKMIAAPLDEHGNYTRLEDAMLAAHELTAVFLAFLEAPSIFMGVPIGALIKPEDLLVLQLMLAAIHSQACTPERQAEAEKYAREQGVGDVIDEIIKMMGGMGSATLAVPPTNGASASEALTASDTEPNTLSPKLEDFLKTLNLKGLEGDKPEGE